MHKVMAEFAWVSVGQRLLLWHEPFEGWSEDFKPTRQALVPLMHVAQLVWLGNRAVVSCSPDRRDPQGSGSRTLASAACLAAVVLVTHV